MCSIAEVTMCRPAARCASPLTARLFASVALAVKITPPGVAANSRATFARAIEGRAGFEPERVLSVRIAHAALEKRPHDRDHARIDRGEARVVEVDAGAHRRDAGSSEPFGRRSGRPRHSSASPPAR